MVVVHGQADLLEVVDALGTPGGLAGRLHGGQQQRDQDGDDGDHHQQFDQRERATRTMRIAWKLLGEMKRRSANENDWTNDELAINGQADAGQLVAIPRMMEGASLEPGSAIAAAGPGSGTEIDFSDGACPGRDGLANGDRERFGSATRRRSAGA